MPRAPFNLLPDGPEWLRRVALAEMMGPPPSLQRAPRRPQPVAPVSPAAPQPVAPAPLGSDGER